MMYLVGVNITLRAKLSYYTAFVWVRGEENVRIFQDFWESVQLNYYNFYNLIYPESRLVSPLQTTGSFLWDLLLKCGSYSRI